MKRTISVGETFAGQEGVVVDTMSFIDLGDTTMNERIGAVLVDDEGIGTYYPPRESRYQLVFYGYPKPIYDEVGNPDNWLRQYRYARPPKPILHQLRLNPEASTPDRPEYYDVRHVNGGDAVRFFWHIDEGKNIDLWWNVEVQRGGHRLNDQGQEEPYPWEVVVEKTEFLTAELLFTLPFTTYYVRVQGVNEAGEVGPYSNVVSYSTHEITGTPIDVDAPSGTIVKDVRVVT